MIKISTKGVQKLRPRTREGRRAQTMALSFLKEIKTERDVLRVLRQVGFYDENGKPNPYFIPETATKAAPKKG